MIRKKAILSLDQGTSGSRAILYGSNAKPLASAYQEFPQSFPKPGWVEHDPEKIWRSILNVTSKVLRQTRISPSEIAGIGITNQRETTILWDRETGKPVYPAIVWQDRRTAGECDRLKKKGWQSEFQSKTGLVLDPYFSGTKIAWILDHVPGVRKKALKGKILFGTIDSWLLWKMTGGQSHATDFTNASRTLLFNIRQRQWDLGLLKVLKIPRQILPKVQASASHYGITQSRFGFPSGIPVFALVGDQQAALYGQGCYRAGEIKNTYGTGCFAVMNLGKKRPSKPPFGLLATLACDQKGKPVYALEGSVFIGGAVIQWLRDGLGLVKKASESESLATSVKDSGGVVLIPAFAGLGSPYWNPHVRGTISGITRGTTRAHFVRAGLESIAQQSADVIEQMRRSGVKVHELKVDGGATGNHFLMQFQADILGIPILVSSRSESTAWGAAKLAAVSSGFWKNLKKVDRQVQYRKISPRFTRAERARARKIWLDQIQRLLA